MQFLSHEQLEVIATNQLDELEQQLLQEHPHWQTSRWGCVLKDSPYYPEFCKVRDASPGGVMLRTAKDLQPNEVSIISINTVIASGKTKILKSMCNNTN